MTGRMRLLAIAVGCIALALGQPPPTYTIAGHLVRRADGRPVKRARVTLSMVDRPERQVSCVTGDKGEFSFTGLPRAKYALEAKDHGWSQLFQQVDYFSTAIATGPGNDSEHIVFQLDAPARIIGTVLDQDGDPVSGAIVTLFARSMANGRFQTQVRMQTGTGTEGEFHFTRLIPGTYYVSASGHPWYAQNFSQPVQRTPEDQNVPPPVPRSELDLAYPIVYYDGGTTPEAATPITLESGSSLDVHFTMHPVPALHIAFDGFQQQEGQQTSLQLFQIGPGGSLLGAPTFSNGKEVTGIAPGSYIASPMLFTQDQVKTLGSQAITLTADATVRLSDTIQTSVKGKVIIEGTLPPSMSIWMTNLSSGTEAQWPVTADGAFEGTNLLPGRYSILLANAGDLYMQSVKVKGSVYKDGELPVAKGAEIELTINAAKGVTKLNGKAVHGTEAVAGAMVLLVPHDPSHGNFIPRDQSDSDGTFTLNWALPGRYTLVAIDNGRGLAYADPKIIAPYLEAGRVLDIPLEKNATVEVEVQSRK